MDVPYTWRPTGWFQIGWSGDFPGAAGPCRCATSVRTSWRTGATTASCTWCRRTARTSGPTSATAARCRATASPARTTGGTWGPDGVNVAIPYQDAPNRSKALRVWPIDEQYGSVYLWHHPEGAPPRGRCPTSSCRSRSSRPTPPPTTSRSPPRRSASRCTRRSSPRTAPTACTSRYVHHASVTPVSLDWDPDGPIWKFLTGWPNTRSDDPDEMILKIHSWLVGLGGSLTAFDGVQQHRLTFTVTPVEHGVSDLFYTVWWPRIPGDDSPLPPPDLQERIDKEFLSTMEDDLEIWRYQKLHRAPGPRQAGRQALQGAPHVGRAVLRRAAPSCRTATLTAAPGGGRPRPRQERRSSSIRSWRVAAWRGPEVARLALPAGGRGRPCARAPTGRRRARRRASPAGG